MGLVGNNAGQLMAMDQSGELRRLFEQGVGGVRRGDNMVDIHTTEKHYSDLDKVEQDNVEI